MNYIFGKDFDYKLYTYEDGKRIQSIPAQTITSYLFDAQPSRASAANGTGAIATFTTTHASGNVITVAVDAVDDPDPSSLTHGWLYWIAVNFKLDNSEQTQTVLRAINIERAVGQDSIIGVTAAKIKEAYPAVDSYASPEEIEAMIQLAHVDLLDDLKNRGFQWAQINSPDQLFNALLFKSLNYVHVSQIQRQGDGFFVKAEMAQRRYEGIITNLKLLIDTDRDGVADAKRPVTSFFLTR